MIRAALATLLALLALIAAPVRADERILNYDSHLAIQADGSLLVTETLTVRAEGNQIRRGIYRDFPTVYTDRYGNRVRVAFEVLGVERDGRPEPWFTERKSNGVRLNTGNDDFLPTPATFTFTLRYRTTRQLGFFPDHDELYWNVTGLGWAFPIDHAQATVTLPSPVPVGDLKLDGYTGPYGSQGKDYQAEATQAGMAVFQSTRSLMPGEGLTIAVSFPKGIIPEPTTAQRLRWFLSDNGGVLVGLVSLLMLAGFYFLRWAKVGRDLPPGPVFPQYDPPAGFGPGELRTLRRMSTDRLCFTADVVDMAVRGYLTIHEDSESDWRLVRNPGAHLDTLTPAQRELAAKLFRDDGEIELKNENASRMQGAIGAHSSEIAKRLQPRYYITNGGSLGLGIVFSLVAGVIAFLVAGGNGIPALVIIAVLAFALHITFGFLLRAPTAEGRKLMDVIDGLKMYLGVAERDELASLKGPEAPPQLDARRYESLLPYAMALEVEKAWTTRFIAAVGTAAAEQTRPTWYVGNSFGTPMGLANLGSSIGKCLGSQISSAATPPGSSSGGGGGGFSGGGGGGGGGGGR